MASFYAPLNKRSRSAQRKPDYLCRFVGCLEAKLFITTTTERSVSWSMKKISDSMYGRVLAGEHVNRTPLGYMRVYLWGRPTSVPDKTNALIIRDSFTRIAHGISLRIALRRASEEGLRNSRGKPLSTSSFHQVVTNPFYMGQIRFKGMRYIGSHEPLVDERTFNKAQEMLTKNRCRNCENP